MCDKVEKVLQNGKLSSAKMTLHADEDKEMVDMMARYIFEMCGNQVFCI